MYVELEAGGHPNRSRHGCEEKFWAPPKARLSQPSRLLSDVTVEVLFNPEVILGLKLQLQPRTEGFQVYSNIKLIRKCTLH